MIQAKVFDSIVNHNKKLANNIFINERAQVSKLLKGSRLKNLFLELIDSNIIEKERFFDLKKDILLRNQVIISEILNLSRSFNEFNINYVFLKGAATIIQIESSRDVRYLSDIDVLIDIKDINKLHLMLKKLRIKHYFDVSHDYFNSRKNHSLEAIQLNSGICVDLHFRASSPLEFNFCPFTENFLKNYDVIIKKNTAVNVLNFDQIYIFSLYQLFIRNEINNCSSSIVDLVLIKNLYSNHISEAYGLLDDSFKSKKLRFLWGSLNNLNFNNLNKFEKKFVIKIFKAPNINFLKRMKNQLINIIYLRRSIKEKYGVRARTKKEYIKFLYYEFKKLFEF